MVTFNNGRNSGIYTKPPFMNSKLCQQFRSSIIWTERAERVSIVSHSRNTSYKWELFIGCWTFTVKIWSKGGYCRVVVFQVTQNLVISLLIIQRVSETIEKVLRQLEAQGWIHWRTLYVTVQENGQRYVSSINTNVKGQHFLPRQLTSDSHRPSADVLTANSKIVNKRAKLRPNIICYSTRKWTTLCF